VALVPTFHVDPRYTNAQQKDIVAQTALALTRWPSLIVATPDE
jgi:hypothetical protein